MRISLLFPASLSLLAACGTPEPETVRSTKQRITAPQISDADFARQIAADTDFALALLPQIGGVQPNLIYSPHSISSALAMLYAGARGDTATEMEAALRFELGAGVHPALNRLDLELQAKRDAVGDPDLLALHTVNDLWLQRDFAVEASYLDTLAEHYGAGVRTLDFVSHSEAARLTINDWIASQTEDRIRDLFPEGSINGQTRLVLTNAIYFKADWFRAFDAADTAPGLFTGVSGQASTVPMMRQGGEIALAEGDGFVAVELPYQGEQLALLVVMPSADRRAAFEANLSGDQLAGIAASLQPQEIVLRLPKLEYDLTLDLNSVLGALGMPTAFTDAADFSGMSTTTRLTVQKVVHKAFVQLDEEGTEAAAATGVSVGVTSVGQGPRQINIDRPFFFFLRDRGTGAVLFVGRVNDLTSQTVN